LRTLWSLRTCYVWVSTRVTLGTLWSLRTRYVWIGTW